MRKHIIYPSEWHKKLEQLAKERGTTVTQIIRDAIYQILKSAGLLIILMIAGCASYPFEKWSKADTVRQSVYTATTIIDCAQTIQISKHPDKYYERGPIAHQIIGEHPEQHQVYQYFMANAGFNLFISSMIKPEWRKGFQYITIGDSLNTVHNNFSIGLKFKF